MLKKKDITSDLISLFGKDAIYEENNDPHEFDKTGNSKTYSTIFRFKKHKSVVRVIITDWSDKITDDYGYTDNLKVEIISSILYKFLSANIYE